MEHIAGSDQLPRLRASACREVTAAEVAHYREHGWAKLDGLVNAATVAQLLRIAHQRMGEDGDSNGRSAIQGQSYFNADYPVGFRDPDLRPVVLGCGRNAKILLGRGPSVDVRYFVDIFIAKLPAAKSARHSASRNTDYHQDFPNSAMDRSGGMTFWIALKDLEPASGTMAFLNGSHRLGPLGAPETHYGRDLTDVHPQLLAQCPSSGQMSYRAGDATVHSSMCVHGASANNTNDPRWAYLVLCNPADACWTGAPSANFATEVLTQWQPLVDSHFPLISGEQPEY